MPLYIGPLGPRVTDSEVTAFLGIDAVIQRDKTTGRSRGFALAVSGSQGIIDNLNGKSLAGVPTLVKELE